MTEQAVQLPDDPLMRPYWEGAVRHELRLQRCAACGHHQHYARPFCLACQSDAVEWVSARGTATVYSLTTVRIAVQPELEPPYVVAVVELDEGPRLTTNIVGEDRLHCRIGDRVRLAWRERASADGTPLPPLPVFERGT